MSRDHATVWDSCLQTIRRNVNSQSFKTWFEPIRPVRLDNNALTIQVPNKFFYEWLEEHYVALLKMTIRKELGDGGRLEYQILMNNGHDNRRSKAVAKEAGYTNGHGNGTPYEPGGIDTQVIKNPFVIPGIKKLKIDPQLNTALTFETFIEGDCNRLARSAGVAVAKKPGGTAFNPLVIFGDVGLGLGPDIGLRDADPQPFDAARFLRVGQRLDDLIGGHRVGLMAQVERDRLKGKGALGGAVGRRADQGAARRGPVLQAGG